MEHVVNYDFPNYISDYIHRAGRVGRVGSSPTSHVTSYIAYGYECEVLWKIEEAARKTMAFHNVNANITRRINVQFGIEANNLDEKNQLV